MSDLAMVSFAIGCTYSILGRLIHIGAVGMPRALSNADWYSGLGSYYDSTSWFTSTFTGGVIAVVTSYLADYLVSYLLVDENMITMLSSFFVVGVSTGILMRITQMPKSLSNAYYADMDPSTSMMTDGAYSLLVGLTLLAYVELIAEA